MPTACPAIVFHPSQPKSLNPTSALQQSAENLSPYPHSGRIIPLRSPLTRCTDEVQVSVMGGGAVALRRVEPSGPRVPRCIPRARLH